MKRSCFSLVLAMNLVTVAGYAADDGASTSTVAVPATTSSSDNSTTTLSTSASSILSNKKFEEDKDITDAKLRADSGSLSRYSLKFNLSYYGPTLNDFSVQDQPNPDGSIGTYETAIAGSFSGRYRIDPSHSISVGTGIKAIHPFGDMDRFDLSNPFMSYDIMNRFGNLQMRNSPGISAITIPNYTKVGEYGSASYDMSMIYNLGVSRWAVGTDFNIGYYLYSRDYRPGSVKAGGDGAASAYSVSLSPMVKYNFTDKFSMNTSLGFSWLNPRSRDNLSVLLNRTITERLGMGYAFTRDIYFAPYLNFYPNRLAMDTTTINVSTIFSIL